MQIPITVPARPTDGSRAGGAEKLDPGRLLLGRVTRIDSDGTARINFPGFEARAQAGKLLHAGRRILAHVQKARAEILLSLLPNADEGQILAGTVARREGTDVRARLAQLGDAELIVRPEASGDSPRAGAPLRAQIQIRGDKVILQMLPSQIGEGAAGGPAEGAFEATVTALRGDGTVTIDVDGTQLLAESADPARIGELVRARLLLIRDKWILQILPKGAEAEIGPAERVAGAAARALAQPRVADLLDALTSGELKPASESLELFALLLQHASSTTGAERGTWLSGLMRALELILLSPHKAELAEQLATAMENSGIFLESRLLRAATSGATDAEISGDLKLALLLAAQKSADASRQSAPQGAGAQSGEIAGKVGQLLDTVTAEQFQNLRLLPTNEIYVQLPFASESGLESVEIHISPQGKQRKIDPQNVVLTLAVSTSNLGRVKAALQIAEGKISCRLKAERKPVVQLLEANSNALKEGLEKLNYQVTYIDCALGRTEEDLTILPGLATTPLDAPGPSPDAGLDVRA